MLVFEDDVPERFSAGSSCCDAANSQCVNDPRDVSQNCQEDVYEEIGIASLLSGQS